MKQFWHKYHRWIIALSTVLVLAGGLAAAYYYMLDEEEGPVEVTSAWPEANLERVVDKPASVPRWPLTGLEAASEKAISRRPVSVKIENSPQSRPQWGIQRADVVYETVTEGGITRFNAIFHSDISGEVGPVRSARLSDVTVVPQYGALFAFSGASSTVGARVNSAGIPNLSQDAGVSYPYYRKAGRRGPHNLWMSFGKLLEEAKRRDMRTTADIRAFQFERSSADATVTVTEVFVPFSDANRVTWTYDEGSDRYLRVNNGSVHKDAETGKQITARNVVVMRAKYRVASRDKFGSTTYSIALTGKGQVSVFRDGQRFDGQWVADEKNPPKFVDADGNQIKLSPGNTWFQVIAPNVNITMK
ncbi:MAG: DUF3048 domain-containing protein [Coriobacteriia bacterium]|nr:DUF3048 domain-containing protein [Coriobacteriia bacterium]